MKNTKPDLYRRIIAHMQDAISVVDTKWRYVDRNDAHRRLFGYSDREFFRKTPIDLVGRKRFKEVVRELLDRGSYRGEMTYRGPDGRSIHVETVLFPVRDAGGGTIAFAGCHRDVGARRQAEEGLRRATQELQFQKSVLESQSEASADGILVVGTDGRILHRNRRFLEMWGLPEEAARKGAPDEDVINVALPAIEGSSKFIARIRRLYRHPREESRDEIRLKDGRTFDRYSAPVLAEDGSILGRVWYFRDVTAEERSLEEQRRSAERVKRALAELKRAQARIIRNEKLVLMGMLVSGVAHEINNPINVVYGNLTLLRRLCGPVSRLESGRRVSAEAAKCLASIPAMVADGLKASAAALRVIREFRNFARDPRSAEPLDLNRCVHETLAVLRKDLAGIRVRRRLGKIPAILGFHGQLNQVLLNLLKNAAEAMRGRGTLTVTTSVRRKRVRVTVEDTGPGIGAAERKRIFEPFYTTKERGMGLGLSLSATIVENHGGRLTVSSREGRGAAFSVDLPTS